MCNTDDVQLKYPPLALTRNTTHNTKKNKVLPKLKNIHNCHSIYELIRYLSFFPDGGEVWHTKRKEVCGEVKISLRKYYKFLIHEHPKGFRQFGHNILQGHMLSQEFLVMNFTREHQQKLIWIIDNQKKSELNHIKHWDTMYKVTQRQGKNLANVLFYLLCIMEVLDGIGRKI